MTTMDVSGRMGECFFWYRLTRVVPDKIRRAVKRLCVCAPTLYGGTPMHTQRHELAIAKRACDDSIEFCM